MKSSYIWLASALIVASCAIVAAATAGTSAHRASSTFRACMVTDGYPVDDRSFNQAAWQGIKSAQKTLGIQGQYVVPSSQNAFAPTIESFISRGCGIIVTVGFAMADVTKSEAAAHSKQRFAIVDNYYTPAIKNVEGLVYLTQQAAFLGGYLAAGMSKTHIVGTFSGMKIAPNLAYLDGFWDGVEYYNSVHHTSVKVLGWNEKTQNGVAVGNYSDIGAAQQIATTMVGQGADILFPVAGGPSLGAARVVKQHGLKMIWFDVDGCVSAPQYCSYMIGSVTKVISGTVAHAVAQAKNGSFHGGNYVGTLANGGVSLVYGKTLGKGVPSALKAEITAVAKRIASGKLKVASHYNPSS